MDERMKPIDRISLTKGFQDKQFELKEKQSLDLLQQAVLFITKQVAEKRDKLQDMERQIKEDRIHAKHLKEKMFQMPQPQLF